MAKPKVVLVTDPMCSWCWGMADEFEQARHQLGELVEFDLILGGINVHGTQPIGDYGRRFLRRLWQEVTETTGQQFGELYPEEYVHNSVLPCLAVQAVNDLSGAVRFDVLYQMQADFFRQGCNINDREYLSELARNYETDLDRFHKLLNSTEQLAKLQFQFDLAGTFGTQALPSLLVGEDPEDANRLSLLAGGYVDADMLNTLVHARLSRV